MKQATGSYRPELSRLLDGEKILQLQQIVRRVPVADHVIRYALQFSRLTRRTEGNCPEFVNQCTNWPAHPRQSRTGSGYTRAAPSPEFLAP